MADYSFSPQFANLAGLQPLPAVDVTRGAALQFQPLQQIEVPSARPELVTESIAGAISNIAQGALGGITARYEKKEAEEKEKRQFAQELLLEEAKQKTKNKQFLDELKLKIASEHGLEADVSERMAAVDEAAQRLGMVNPSGEVAETIPRRQKPSVTPVPVEPELPSAIPVGGWTPESESKDFTTQVAETEVAPQIPIPTAVAAPTLEEISIPSPNVQPASTQGLALSELPVAPVSQPALTEVTSATPYQQQELPSDPKSPRSLSGALFNPQDASAAYDAAAKLTSPYWKVVPEQDPRTKRWFLRQENTSAEVEKAQAEAERLGISKEELVLKQRAAERDAAKSELERIDAQRKILKEDKSLLKTQKNNIQQEANKLSFIDRAIEGIESDKDIVGIMSQYYLGAEKMPFVPGTYKEWAIVAKNLGFDVPANKIQKIVDIQENLRTIEANLGWQAFAQMKELSPSGSAGVGGLTEGERQSLERIPGSLSITQSPENLLSNLYNLKNGAIKTIANASDEVNQIDPTFKKPLISRLKFNPDDDAKIKQINDALQKATPQQKQSQNYKNAVEKLEMLLRQKDRIEEFNKQFGSNY